MIYDKLTNSPNVIYGQLIMYFARLNRRMKRDYKTSTIAHEEITNEKVIELIDKIKQDIDTITKDIIKNESS